MPQGLGQDRDERRADALDRHLSRLPPAAGGGPDRLRRVSPLPRQEPGAQPGRPLHGPSPPRVNWVARRRSSKIAATMLRRLTAPCLCLASVLPISPPPSQSHSAGAAVSLLI